MNKINFPPARLSGIRPIPSPKGRGIKSGWRAALFPRPWVGSGSSVTLVKIFSLLLALLLMVGCDVAKREPKVEEETLEKSQVTVAEAPSPPRGKVKEESPVDSVPPKSSVETAKAEALLDPIPDPLEKPENPPVVVPPTPLKEADSLSQEAALAALNQPLEYFEGLDSTPIIWGPGPTSGEAVPSAVKDLQETYSDKGAYFYIPNSKEIFLSFDEGYELGYTESLLDTLKEKGVTAVFFVTYGYVQSRPDLVARMVNEGHILGNHSTTHPVGGLPTLAPVAMAQDILKLHNYVKENFDYNMSLLRPPEGTFSQQSLAVTQAIGYESIFWSFAYNDWNPENQPVPDKAIGAVVGSSHPGGIYLLHAVSKTNTEILGTVIDQLRDKDYTFSNWNNLVAYTDLS